MIALEIREKQGWANWAWWAKILKITLTDNQLCSLICFCIYMFLSKHPIIPFKIKRRQLNELEYSKTPSQMSNYSRTPPHRSHWDWRFLVACTRFYNPLCPSVGRSVGDTLLFRCSAHLQATSARVYCLVYLYLRFTFKERGNHIRNLFETLKCWPLLMENL